MTWAEWNWTALAVIAAGGIVAVAIYTFGWHDSDRESDGKAKVEQAEAISAVRLRAKQACEAPWWEDDYCVRRVRATKFAAANRGEGIWLVREHVRGDQPFQDTCWLVEPERLTGFIGPDAGLWPASCECPFPSTGPSKDRPPPVPPDGRELDPEVARILSALCPGWVPEVVPARQ